jgi:hypothetical protein
VTRTAWILALAGPAATVAVSAALSVQSGLVARRPLVRVVSIEEADPHSGIAHRYVWSKDSKALLIYGWGRLPDDYDQIVKLCLVYLPEGDALHRLTACSAVD